MVKRYLIGVYGEHEHPNGDFVHWQDYHALRAELEQVKRERDAQLIETQRAWNERDGEKRKRINAERLAGARVVTDGMVKAFQDKYREFWKGIWPDTETSRKLLEAALAEPAGEAEPKILIHEPMAWTGEGPYGFSPVTTPPDASAIRGAQVEAVVQAVRPYTRETLLIDEHRDLVRAALAGAKP